jgi:hypothetical protein
MKSLIFISTLFVISGFAHAVDKTAHQFTCATDKPIEYKDPKKPHQVIKPTEFSFVLENLESKKPSYWTEKEEDEPIVMNPADSVLDLNENWQLISGPKGLELNSDGDGCQYTTVILYKDKGYKKGYVRVDASKTGCGGDDVYSTVTCKVELKK